MQDLTPPSLQIVYVLTNPAMPGLVKIGRTSQSEVQARVDQLFTTSVPLPFECVFACKVEDSFKVEKAIHFAFGKDRINPTREFFRIEPERVVAILKLLDVSDVTASFERASSRTSARLTFKRRVNLRSDVRVWISWRSVCLSGLPWSSRRTRLKLRRCSPDVMCLSKARHVRSPRRRARCSDWQATMLFNPPRFGHTRGKRSNICTRSGMAAMMTDQPIATARSWKRMRPPAERLRARLSYEGRFSSDQMASIQRGFVPVQMEDKWFVYYSRGWLRFHRSWTGALIYALRFHREGSTWLVSDSWVNRDPKWYAETDVDADRELVEQLIVQLLLPSTQPA